MFSKYKFSGLLFVSIIFLIIAIYFVRPNQGNAPVIVPVNDNFKWQIDRKDMPAEIRRSMR